MFRDQSVLPKLRSTRLTKSSRLGALTRRPHTLFAEHFKTELKDNLSAVIQGGGLNDVTLGPERLELSGFFLLFRGPAARGPRRKIVKNMF